MIHVRTCDYTVFFEMLFVFTFLIARLARSNPRNSFLCCPCIFLFVLAFSFLCLHFHVCPCIFIRGFREFKEHFENLLVALGAFYWAILYSILLSLVWIIIPFLPFTAPYNFYIIAHFKCKVHHILSILVSL